VERVRAEQLTAIVEESDQPFPTLLRVGQKALFGSSTYAYPTSGTPDAVKATTAADLTGFWKAQYAPQKASIVLCGDLTGEQARQFAEQWFGDWTNPSAAPVPQPPEPPGNIKQRIILVDKPGAPQTVLGAFGVGLPRTTNDYAASEVMNNILGGLFSSRINMNLRERHGYTYGAFSRFRYSRGNGPFFAAAMVRTDVTTPSTEELLKELHAISTTTATEAEVALGKNYALHSLPGEFEVADTTSKLIGDLFVYNLPDDYYKRLPVQFDALTSVAITAAAKKHVNPQQMIVVAVGDRSKIESGLDKLGLGPIELRDALGNLLPAQ
jgi:zinc protease